MSETFRIAIIETDCLMREGLMQVLRRHHVRIVGAWSSLEEAVAAPNTGENPSVILVSTVSLGMLEPEDAEALRQRYPGARIALLAELYGDGIASVVAAAQVDGVLLASSSPTNLVRSLELIAFGQAVFPRPIYMGHSEPSLSEGEATTGSGALGKLSAREQQVLAGLAKGASNKVIARQLAITDATVKVHVKSILRKTGAGNRTEAALWAHNVAFGGG